MSDRAFLWIILDYTDGKHKARAKWDKSAFADAGSTDWQEGYSGIVALNKLGPLVEEKFPGRNMRDKLSALIVPAGMLFYDRPAIHIKIAI